jgi:hypothetical protein
LREKKEKIKRKKERNERKLNRVGVALVNLKVTRSTCKKTLENEIEKKR